MALPLDSVRTQTPVHQEPIAAPSNPNPADAAKRILEVGSQWGTDDYDARLDAFVDELGKGDATYRDQLMAEIFKQDPNALGSWLQPARANHLQSDGRISSDQKALLAEGIAAAYNNGNIPQAEIGAGATPGTGADGKIQFSELDNGLLTGFYTSAGLGAGPDTLQNAENLREFIDFFGSSSGPEVAEFRQTYAKHLIDQYVLNPAVGYNNPTQRDAAALLAGNLLSFDTNRPELAVNVLQNYKPDQLKTIMESAARADSNLGEEALTGLAQSRNLDAKDISVYDGGTLMMLAVARTDSPAADKLALEFAKMAHDAPDVFEGAGGNDRVDALTLTVNSHSEYVLNALTNLDLTNIQSRSDTSNVQFKENATDLAALLGLTMLNPDSTYSSMLQGKVVEYAAALTNKMNSEPGSNPDEVARLSMLQASMSDAITQGFDKINADAAKKKEFMTFALDLALSALPIGKWTTDGVENAIKKAFPNSPNVQEALKGLSGKLLETAGPTKLTEEAKTAIVDALGKEEGGLEIAKETVNGFIETVQTNLTDPADKADFTSTYLAVYGFLTK